MTREFFRSRAAYLNANGLGRTRKEGQVFVQNFVGGDQLFRLDRETEINRTGMKAILGAGQRRPVERIGKNSLHAFLFGRP